MFAKPMRLHSFQFHIVILNWNFSYDDGRNRTAYWPVASESLNPLIYSSSNEPEKPQFKLVYEWKDFFYYRYAACEMNIFLSVCVVRLCGASVCCCLCLYTGENINYYFNVSRFWSIAATFNALFKVIMSFKSFPVEINANDVFWYLKI